MGHAVEVALRTPARLGAGPTWDPAAARLLWVDILGREVHAYDPVTGADTVRHTAQHVGAAKPRASGGLVVNLRDGAGLYDLDGAFRWLAGFPSPGCRGNDAAVGPDGCLWAGTMRYDEAERGGRLHRVGPDGKAVIILTDVTVGNGIAWSPDERLMYYADTPTQRIDVFDYHPEGEVGFRRPFVVVPGHPDGLTVDADGRVWVALRGGGRMLGYTPGGDLDRVIDIPARQTTACAFGGSDLRDLYVTTATVGAPQYDAHAGSLFVVSGVAQGLPSRAFPG